MELREINVTPHIARGTTRRSAIDGRTRLCSEPAHRRGFRLDANHRGLTKNKISRVRKSPMGFHLRRRGVEFDQIVKVDVRSMKGTAVRCRDLPKAYQD
jgi:hypothetical protein